MEVIENMRGKSEKDEPLLKTYFKRYLLDVRGVSSRTVKHYCDALNNITRHLKEKHLIRDSIYEVTDLKVLHDLRDILLQDADFVALDRRGNRMYTAGFNNYLRFAEGQSFAELHDRAGALDIPMPPIAEEPRTYEVHHFMRSDILRGQTLAFADYRCEMDGDHKTFIAERTHKPYMESHHAIPIHLQGKFEHSLDIYANLVCLCPICHRKIHYGLMDDRRLMMYEIYEKRHERLSRSGITLGKEEFADLVLHDGADYARHL
ncbi:HNH endonuclease [Mitsuokella sp.]|uniref:HNH endonuclease n=2 Tax=Mitsuokella TaxID=52225 RepID=UPI003D7C60D9